MTVPFLWDWARAGEKPQEAEESDPWSPAGCLPSGRALYHRAGSPEQGLGKEAETPPSHA